MTNLELFPALGLGALPQAFAPAVTQVSRCGRVVGHQEPERLAFWMLLITCHMSLYF
jgi:hypothetical protein